MNSIKSLLTACIVIAQLFYFSGCIAVSPFTKVKRALQNGKPVQVKEAVFDKAIDLTSFLDFKEVAPGKKVALIREDVVFVNCMFKDFIAYKHDGNTTYSIEFKERLSFINCTFNGKVDLSHAIINHNLSLQHAVFAGPVSLSNCWIKGRQAHFASAIFHQPARLSNMIVENKCSFFKTSFEQSVIFQHSCFKGPFSSGGATFKEYAGFDHVHFAMGVAFDQSVFYGNVIFDWTQIMGMTSFVSADFKKDISLKKAHLIGPCDFREMKKEGACNLEYTYFLCDTPGELLSDRNK